MEKKFYDLRFAAKQTRPTYVVCKDKIKLALLRSIAGSHDNIGPCEREEAHLDDLLYVK